MGGSRSSVWVALAGLVLAVSATLLGLNGLGVLECEHPDPEYLRSRIWRFEKTAGTELASQIMLSEPRSPETFVDFAHLGESRWNVNSAGHVELRSADSGRTTEFTRCKRRFWRTASHSADQKARLSPPRSGR